MSTISLCIIPMPTDRAVELAARIADADDPDCEALLHSDGPEVCDVLRREVLHQAEVIERRTAELSTAHGEIARLLGVDAATHDRWHALAGHFEPGLLRALLDAPERWGDVRAMLAGGPRG